MRALSFEEKTWEKYERLRVDNKKNHDKLCKLIKVTLRTPEEGDGKPEPLTDKFEGMWSRRITQKDRFVYEYDDDRVYVHAVGGHYGDK